MASRPIRVASSFFPEWLTPLGAVGQVTSYQVLPKAGGYRVSVEVPTGTETHTLTITVPKRTEAAAKYAYALMRVAKTLQEGLPPPQRELGYHDTEEPRRL